MDAALLGDGVADLPFQVELLLPAHLEGFAQPPGRTVNGGTGTALIGTARQVHGRDDVLALGMRLLRRQHRRQAVDGQHFLGPGRHTPRQVPRFGDDGEHRLAQVAHFAVAQDGVVVQDGAAVVRPRNVGRRQHRHHAGQGTQAIQRHGGDAAMGHGRQAQRAVQRARQLGNVVNVGRLARHMQVRRLVGTADAHAGAPLLRQRLGLHVDARGGVLLVAGKGLRRMQQAGVDGLVHVRLLALRCGASRSIRWWPRGAKHRSPGSPATNAGAGFAPPAGDRPPRPAYR